MTPRQKLRAPEGLDPEIVALLQGLLEAIELPIVLAPKPARSRAELVELRAHVADLLWERKIEEGNISLKWLHRESRWRAPDEPLDEFRRVHQAHALLNMMDYLIAALRDQDSVAVNLSAKEEPRGG